MWRYWEKHPVWNGDPKLKLLPAEGLYGRMRGWPASERRLRRHRRPLHPARHWSAVLIASGVGYFVQRVVGELRAIRRQLEELTEQLAEAEAGREAERAHFRGV